MLIVDVVTRHQVGRLDYDMTIRTKALYRLGLHWHQTAEAAQHLAQTARLTDVRIALVSDSPNKDLVPLPLLEAADLVRCWSLDQETMVRAKDRDGLLGPEEGRPDAAAAVRMPAVR